MKKIFVVEDTFDIKGKGIALVGIPEQGESLPEVGSVILVRQVGREDMSAQVLGTELMRNCWSSHKPRNMVVLVSSDVGINTIGVGAEVWCHA